MASSVSFPAERRAQIVAALAVQNDNPAALGKLAQANTVAVITGQQVGFLLGPAYTIFKALTAVRLAQQLNEQGISAVPIFWCATEDHDLAEVDHAWVFNQDASPAKISVASSVVNGGPVGDVVLNEIPLAELRAALGDLPFADEVMREVAASYQPGATLGSAFRKLLEQTLKGLGFFSYIRWPCCSGSRGAVLERSRAAGARVAGGATHAERGDHQSRLSYAGSY